MFFITHPELWEFPVDGKLDLNRAEKALGVGLKWSVFMCLCVASAHFRLLGLHVCCCFDVAVMM